MGTDCRTTENLHKKHDSSIRICGYQHPAAGCSTYETVLCFKKAITGIQGLQGCIVRVTQWASGVNYRNDEALTSGERYIDLVVHRISNVERHLEAKHTHNGGNIVFIQPAALTQHIGRS